MVAFLCLCLGILPSDTLVKSKCGLPALPKIEIPSDLSGHQYVALNCVNLTDISRFSFEGVLHLNLSGNPLGSLNNTTLSDLEVLDIRQTSVNPLPELICSLPKLRRIDMGDVLFPSIPDCICNTGNLEVLNIDMLDIGMLPALSKCRKLRNLSIEVGDKKLDEHELELLSNMDGLTNLKLIFVNEIADLPAGLTNRITSLSIDPGEDSYLPGILNTISRIRTLETLELEVDAKELNFDLPKFERLKTLIVRRSTGGARVKLPESVKQISTLESIYEFENSNGLSKNVTIICRYGSAAKYLKLGYKTSNYVDPNVIE